VLAFLAWVDSLPAVTVEAWRVPAGDRVQLSIASTLSDPVGTVELDVFGAVAYEPARIADLKPGNRRTVSLGQLRTWAISGPVPDGHGYQ
jgi:hypothetical protein